MCKEKKGKRLRFIWQETGLYKKADVRGKRWMMEVKQCEERNSLNWTA